MHYNDVIMGTMAFQITNLTIVCSSVYSGADQRKYQSFASLFFERGIHRSPVNSPHKGPVTRKMFPFDDAIMMDVFRIYRLQTGCRYREPVNIRNPGPRLDIKTVFPGMWISIIAIRLSQDRLIFMVDVPILTIHL